MDKSKLYTLSLKFQRHNIQFEHKEQSAQVLIGKTAKVKRKIIQGILLVVLSIPLLVFIAPMNYAIRKIIIFVLFMPIAYGISQIYKYVKLAGKNKYRKLIGKSAIHIETAEGMKVYEAEHIDSVEIEYKRDGDMEGEGAIYFIHRGEKIYLLHLSDKRLADLKADLEYLQDFIMDVLDKTPPVLSKAG